VRRNTLYGSRVRGDLDLGYEPSRLDGAGDQQWAEMDFPGGRLPGSIYQGVWETSTTQKYHIGTRRVSGDRVFRYAHVLAGSGDCTKGWGVANQNTVEERAGASWDVDGVVGDTVVYINAMVHDITLNQFAGGYLLYADVTAGQSNMIPIISNTAATVGNPSTVVLGHPLTGAATAGITGSTLTGSIFGNVLHMQLGSAGYQTAVGVPIVNLPDDNYGWIQTWGPCLVVPNGATGDTPAERRVGFQNDGAIRIWSGLAGDHQPAGVVASCTFYNGIGNSSNWIILQMFP